MGGYLPVQIKRNEEGQSSFLTGVRVINIVTRWAWIRLGLKSSSFQSYYSFKKLPRSTTQAFSTRKFIHANRSKMSSMDQFKASMVLSAVGDALGYKNGEWEFCYSGEAIHQQLQTLGGLERIDVKGWIVSDDTVLHLATAEALVSPWKTREELFLKLAANYKAGMVSRIPLKLN